MSVAKIITFLLLALFYTFVESLVLSIKLIGHMQLVLSKQPIKATVWIASLSVIHLLNSNYLS